MTFDTAPDIGNWYQDVSGNSFEIVAFDKKHGLIEIQFYDGTVEEMDLETWYEQMFIAAEPPEDWSGSLDIEKQDYGVDLDADTHMYWDNPLDTFDA